MKREQCNYFKNFPRPFAYLKRKWQPFHP